MPRAAVPYLDPTPHPRPRRTFREAFTKSCADRAGTFGTASLVVGERSLAQGLRLARAVHAARIAQAARAASDRSAYDALGRHGFDARRGLGRRDATRGDVVVPALNASGAWALAAALDVGVPVAAAASMAGAL